MALLFLPLMGYLNLQKKTPVKSLYWHVDNLDGCFKIYLTQVKLKKEPHDNFWSTDFGFPKPGIPQLIVFSLMHRAKDDDSGIYDFTTDLLGEFEQSPASG